MSEWTMWNGINSFQKEEFIEIISTISINAAHEIRLFIRVGRRTTG